jgi:dTDP-4-amino-4,6-dideoxygalactose transaminase
MERKTIHLCLAHMSEEGLEQKYIKEAFDTNWVVPLGPNVNAFEKDLEDFVNETTHFTNDTNKLSKRVVALSSGTAAVHLGLLNCGVGPGDEVIVQSFTFCASTHPVTYLGATPVLVDSEPDTWNIDPELLEEAIKDRIAKTGKIPKAIVPVALYGMPYKIDRIMEIANRYEIPVVEDAAEGFGSRYKGRVLGTFGKYGVLSFNGNKMITTSGGGALIAASDDEWREIMMYATQYRESFPYYQHEKIGYNYRMSNICAGIGRGQMTVLEEHLAHHKHVQALYEELLADVPGIHVHSQPATGEYDSNYWLCTITIDEDVRIKGQEGAYKTIVTSAIGGAAGVIHAASSATTDCQPNDNVEALREFMNQANIEARPLWKPMHKQPVYASVPAYVNGVSEALFKIGLCLPAGPCVSDDDVRYIVETIKDAIER